MTRQEDVAAAIDEAIGLLGHLDIVVNNAGGTNFIAPFLDMRLSGWDKVMRLNLDAAIYVCQAAGRHMLERGQGSVINVASVARLTAVPGLTPYGAAKACGSRSPRPWPWSGRRPGCGSTRSALAGPPRS